MTSVSQWRSGDEVRHRPVASDGTGGGRRARRLVLGPHLATGRAGAVYEVEGPLSAQYVVKLYQQDPPERLESLLESLQVGGLDASTGGGSVAVPEAVVTAVDDDVPIGILVPRVQGVAMERAMRATVDLRPRHRMARNLARAVHLVHGSDHLIGDLSPTNVFVTQGERVVLIDADSFGRSLPGDQWRLDIAPPHTTPNYAPPQHLPPLAADRFVMAVIILEILLRVHPFGGVRETDPDATAQLNITDGVTWLRQPDQVTLPHIWSDHPGLATLPPSVALLAERSLAGRPPSALAWATALDSATIRPGECGHFVYAAAEGDCLACAQADPDATVVMPDPEPLASDQVSDPVDHGLDRLDDRRSPVRAAVLWALLVVGAVVAFLVGLLLVRP